ncbi:hypothetical protein HELRODRAFT_172918 [Helobdella robusta]|uniref:Uncharacterized protein n=1 Tax=Helobdella robusta TaxID=6412 RepID=T1F647_HELRO|nr:hypothetical protein HELRODRAFT_172918 [Helobdella robusta]ESO03891.1 hypothetical protein HELRODRAFT_172918 [Helobdella robusta]
MTLENKCQQAINLFFLEFRSLVINAFASMTLNLKDCFEEIQPTCLHSTKNNFSYNSFLKLTVTLLRSYKKGGGTGFLVKNNLIYEVLDNFSHDFNVFEWSGVKIICNAKTCYYICVYRPPGDNLPNTSKRNSIKTRIINSDNIAQANDKLAKFQRPDTQHDLDLDTEYDIFLMKYMDIIDHTCPLLNKKNRFRKPWMDIDLY